jgi:hypothetical protein
LQIGEFIGTLLAGGVLRLEEVGRKLLAVNRAEVEKGEDTLLFYSG